MTTYKNWKFLQSIICASRNSSKEPTYFTTIEKILPLEGKYRIYDLQRRYILEKWISKYQEILFLSSRQFLLPILNNSQQFSIKCTKVSQKKNEYFEWKYQ